MTENVTKNQLHLELLRDWAGSNFTEDDALWWMVLFHTHALVVRPGVLSDVAHVRGEGPTVAALTQRHAAEVVAAVWAERKQGAAERGHYTYWYHQYALRTPYEVLEDIPEEGRSRLQQFRASLAQDPRVELVRAED